MTLAVTNGYTLQGATALVLILACGKESQPSATDESLAPTPLGIESDSESTSRDSTEEPPLDSTGENNTSEPISIVRENTRENVDTPQGARDQRHGAACVQNEECVVGLQCFTGVGSSTTSAISIPNGICSASCNSDEQCNSFGASSFCRTPLLGGSVSFCTLPCQASVVSDNKCLGRRDMFCNGPPGGPGTCINSCVTHDDCGGGSCNFSTGLCESRPDFARTTPVGGICEATGPFVCEGYCVRAEGQQGWCSQSCPVGGYCGGSEANVCVPGNVNQKLGDVGQCGRSCTSNESCETGVTECTPTGLQLPDGSPEQYCAIVARSPSTVLQRLPTAAMREANLAAEVLTVSTSYDGAHQLEVVDGKVCITGSMSDEGFAASLGFQFASNDGTPFDAEAFTVFRFNATSTLPFLVEALRSDLPQYLYRSQVIDGLTRSFGEGDNEVLVDQFASSTTDAAPSWDPSQLAELRFRPYSGEADSPFQFCLSELSFGAETPSDSDSDAGVAADASN